LIVYPALTTQLYSSSSISREVRLSKSTPVDFFRIEDGDSTPILVFGPGARSWRMDLQIRSPSSMTSWIHSR